jgi:UDP-N-acetylmuramoylalanine--D-glutamate ligase
MNGYENCSAVVLGLGMSGEWAARLLLAHGAGVSVFDGGEEQKQAGRAEALRRLGAAVTFGKTLPEDLAADVCVASPAFEMAHPWLEACRKAEIPIISELELGWRYWQGRTIAVTGSKGKSSLVKLCSDTLNAAGVSASPAGNYGIPLCQLVMERPDLKWAVVEVSSFQMEHTETYRPDVAILLNFQADHQDRHGSMAEYKAMKLKLFRQMDGDTLALLPAGLDAEGKIPAGTMLRRFGDEAGSDWRYAGHAVRGTMPDAFRDELLGCPDETPRAAGQGQRVRVDMRGSWFDNEILGLAAAAAVPALLYAGLSPGQVEAGLKAFVPLEHRMQVLGTDKGGVTYVDDSKATSLSATAAALRMARKPIRLIAGGLLKEKDLGSVKELLTQTTKKVYLIGRCSGEMGQAWSDAVPCEDCGTLERAVSRAAEEAQPGETVLLSPGTASFDQFTGYRERGERFSSLARAVAGL